MKKFLLGLMLLVATMPAHAAQTARLTYDIKVWDIPIGTMVMTITRDLAAYEMQMSGSFGGIAALFSTGDGKMQASGTMIGGKVLPFYMHQNVAWDDEPRTIEMHFKDGRVADYKIDPPHKFNPETRHALDPMTLADVRDPLSATIQLYDPAKSACDYPVRVFDGRERYDLQMVPDANDKWHCRVTPQLISGYKKKHDKEENKPQSFDMYFTTIMNDTLLVPKLTVRPMAVGRVKIELADVTVQ